MNNFTWSNNNDRGKHVKLSWGVKSKNYHFKSQISCGTNLLYKTPELSNFKVGRFLRKVVLHM
jgi:hypothetical protein